MVEGVIVTAPDRSTAMIPMFRCIISGSSTGDMCDGSSGPSVGAGSPPVSVASGSSTAVVGVGASTVGEGGTAVGVGGGTVAVGGGGGAIVGAGGWVGCSVATGSMVTVGSDGSWLSGVPCDATSSPTIGPNMPSSRSTTDSR